MAHLLYRCRISAFALGLAWLPAAAQDATLEIHADQILHPVSRYLTGACLEDVNHEVYGGIYSQMIFGESFQEPAPLPTVKEFTAFGGRWECSGEVLQASGGDGAKLVSQTPAFADGEASVEIRFSDTSSGNAGLIVKVSDPGPGRDQFNGYEIALEPSGNLVLGRHRQNWEAIRRVPCAILTNDWNKLMVRMSGATLEIFVNSRSVMNYEDTEHPLPAGTIGLRTWQREASFRNLSVTAAGQTHQLAFISDAGSNFNKGVSGMWSPLHRGAATGTFALDAKNPFVGSQSQTITFTGGSGEIGIGNQSLNRWGMNFVKEKVYEGHLWAQTAEPTDLFVALESCGGEKIYAEKKLKLPAGDWQRLDFSLMPNKADTAGRFAIKLKRAGSVTLGYAFLGPGSWGRFKNLPVRKDVAESLIGQGITVLRYGGSMVNHPQYRWKKMIGARDRRSPCAGNWYAYSSNGWGIFDFLNFCEAAGFLAVPDFNADETPQDMSDFVEYVNGPATSEWGRQRAANGHPQSYHLKHLQFGNEEAVNEKYFEKFKPVAEAIWSKDPDMILIVGDFCYKQPIEDPFHFAGADSGITSLAAQQKILQLAKQHNREVWFDIHTDTEGPRPRFGGMFTYMDAIDKIADGAKHRVLTFEFNANNHAHRRGLANAAAINAVERDGRMPIATSANCLQPDGQNDNGWDQGLLFLNPAQAWLQSPGYVTRMISQNYQPREVKCDVRGDGNNLDVSVKRSEDGKTLVAQVVNFSEHALPARIVLRGFAPAKSAAQVEELTGSLNTANTALAPERVKPYALEWKHQLEKGEAVYIFPPQSFTVIKLQ